MMSENIFTELIFYSKIKSDFAQHNNFSQGCQTLNTEIVKKAEIR